MSADNAIYVICFNFDLTAFGQENRTHYVFFEASCNLIGNIEYGARSLPESQFSSYVGIELAKILKSAEKFYSQEEVDLAAMKLLRHYHKMEWEVEYGIVPLTYDIVVKDSETLELFE